MKQTVLLLIVVLLCMSCDSTPTGKQGASHGLHRVFYRSMLPKDAEFSADGKYLLTSDFCSIDVWRTKDFALLKSLKLLSPKEEDLLSDEGFLLMVGAHFTPDAKSVFVGFNNGKALLIDLNSGKKTALDFGKRRTRPEICKISKSGNILVLGDRYMDISRGKRAARHYHQTGSGENTVITSDGKYIVTSYIWTGLGITETATAKVKGANLSMFFLFGLFDNLLVEGFKVSPDNDSIAVYFRNGNDRLYSISREKEIGAFKTIYGFSPDGKMVVTSSGGNNVSIWDIAHGKKKKSLKLYQYLGWLRGTDWIASFSEQGELVIQSTETGEIIRKEKLPVPTDVVLEQYHYIDYNPAERLLVLGNGWQGHYCIDIYKIK